MTSENFCYWLQGWFELNGTIDHRDGATPETLKMIKNHLNMVFAHDIDPKLGGGEEHQQNLQDLHDGQSAPLLGRHTFGGRTSSGNRMKC